MYIYIVHNVVPFENNKSLNYMVNLRLAFAQYSTVQNIK